MQRVSLNSKEEWMANLIEIAPQLGLPTGAQSVTATQQELPSPVPLMALSTGFWAFKTLAAAHEFDLFSRLSNGAGMTCQRVGASARNLPRPAEMLLTGCAALGLLEKSDGRYRNTPISEAYLVRGNPIISAAGSDGRQAALCRLGQTYRGAPHQPADHVGPGRADPRCSTARTRRCWHSSGRRCIRSPP